MLFDLWTFRLENWVESWFGWTSQHQRQTIFYGIFWKVCPLVGRSLSLLILFVMIVMIVFCMYLWRPDFLYLFSRHILYISFSWPFLTVFICYLFYMFLLPYLVICFQLTNIVRLNLITKAFIFWLKKNKQTYGLSWVLRLSYLV